MAMKRKRSAEQTTNVKSNALKTPTPAPASSSTKKTALPKPNKTAAATTVIPKKMTTTAPIPLKSTTTATTKTKSKPATKPTIMIKGTAKKRSENAAPDAPPAPKKRKLVEAKKGDKTKLKPKLELTTSKINNNANNKPKTPSTKTAKSAPSKQPKPRKPKAALDTTLDIAKEKEARASATAARSARAAKREVLDDTIEAKRSDSIGSNNSSVKENVAISHTPVEVVLSEDTIEDHQATTRSLNSLASEKAVVVFIYPKADTPGCTKQACGFRDNYSKFKDAGYEVYGLSADSPSAQSSWKTKNDLPFSLLCDSTRTVIKKWGADQGKSCKRGHVIFDKGGKLLDIQMPLSPTDSVGKALEYVTAHPKNI